ncbi:MAG: metal ABC transporter permease [bacterium]|nr:metal ABC transporter permease [bacterium]
MSTNIDSNLIASILVGVFVGAASAYLGSLMVLKRMALVGDALSHVALPGIGIALTYGINPFLGAFSALAVGVFLVWKLEEKTDIPAEAIVGIIFAVALAVGILVTPEPELLESLFGDISKVNLMDAILGVVLSLVVLVATFAIRRRILLDIVSSDLARSQGINTRVWNFVFMALVAVVVALGVKVVGTLLMGALVVIPAAASKNIAKNFSTYGFMSVILGSVSALGGILLAFTFNLPPGPLVVLSSAAVFLLSLFAKK